MNLAYLAAAGRLNTFILGTSRATEQMANLSSSHPNHTHFTSMCHHSLSDIYIEYYITDKLQNTTKLPNIGIASWLFCIEITLYISKTHKSRDLTWNLKLHYHTSLSRTHTQYTLKADKGIGVAIMSAVGESHSSAPKLRMWPHFPDSPSPS